MTTTRLFNPGKFIVARSLKENTARLMPYLLRHLKGDWGDLGDEDKNENDLAVKAGDLRIFSAYEIDDDREGMADLERIWIITEADRSATTILLPSDY
ncbi:MAG: hypothetical protein HN916_09850 [Anaerolineae bacterium]|jgi:hypothetical protein|nr:hypothetical protein [Anaerolineae bacterium]MBT7990006.1 hypothetical protein [Anaerolineae bacterium]